MVMLERALENNNNGNDQSIRYLENVMKLNPGLVELSAELHRKNLIPVSTYVLDLEAHIRNAMSMIRQARRYNITLYYMSKQIARNPIIVQAVLNTGFGGIVAVEPQELRSLVRYGIKVGNVGHLANVPENEIDYVLKMAKPEVITVFSLDKAKMISNCAERLGLPKQKLLVRPTSPDDTKYAYMEGGVNEENVIAEIQKINSLPKVQVAGLTSFPCMLYDLKVGHPVFMHNMDTLCGVAERARNSGIELPMINTPPLCTTNTIPMYASRGSTHLEPGAGVSGTAVWGVYSPDRNPEIPAVVHVTEVSHFFDDFAYVFGGGFNYIELYELAMDGKSYVPDLAKTKLKALVGRSSKELMTNPVDALPYIGMIDYHAKLAKSPHVHVGDTVVFGFRTQIFVTRSQVAVVSGINENNPKLIGLFDHANNLIDRFGHLMGEEATIDLMKKYSGL
jgi:predicted amino acid racemase